MTDTKANATPSTTSVIIWANRWDHTLARWAINRAGEERGARFIGKSQIVDPGGRRLDLADTTEETIIAATFDPTLARQKRLVISPGVFEIDTVGDRRPELYHRIVED